MIAECSPFIVIIIDSAVEDRAVIRFLTINGETAGSTSGCALCLRNRFAVMSSQPSRHLGIEPIMQFDVGIVHHAPCVVSGAKFKNAISQPVIVDSLLEEETKRRKIAHGVWKVARGESRDAPPMRQVVTMCDAEERWVSSSLAKASTA
jgi:hypothetical protein